MRCVNGRTMLALAITLASCGAAVFSFGVSAAVAQDAKLVAVCPTPAAETPPAPPPPPPPTEGSTPDTPAPAAAPRPQYAVSCDVRVTDAVAVQGVSAAVKGGGPALQTKYTAFDPKEQMLSAMFLIQVVDPQRARTAQQMADAVLKIAEAREGKRRFAAYSIANDLTLLAGFVSTKADFDKAVRGLKPQTLPTQLYQTTLEAIDKLAREPGNRKAIVLVGDGNSDDTGYTHEQVVQAARNAGVVIHALGFVEQATELPRFQILRRLAEDTGGFRREVRLAREARFNITPTFAADVMENGGALKIIFKDVAGKDITGPVTLSLSANLGSGRSESSDKAFDIPLPPPEPEKPLPETKPEEPEPTTLVERMSHWVRDNAVISYAMGLGFGLAALGFLLFAFGRRSAPVPAAAAVTGTASAGQGQGVGQGARPGSGSGVVYGWLEMLDGNATRHPLNTTNVRIGRHRDNDVCLQNDSISRRHAILHYNADTKRFIITDLGGDNGVVVNDVREKSHELNDGDLIELGEVRLRFRPNLEFLG